MPRAWPENGATAVSMVAAFTALSLLLGRVVTVMLSLEAKLNLVSLVWPILYLLQGVLVGKRRSSGHWLVQYGAMAAYYLPALLVVFAARAVYSSSTSDIINGSIASPVAVVLCMFLCTVVFPDRVMYFTNTRTYSLRERPQHRFSFVMLLVYLVFLEWELFRVSNAKRRLEILHIAVVYFLLTWIIVFGIFLLVMQPKSTLDCQTKAVADYMKWQKSSNLSTSSPSTSTSTSPFFDDDANSSSSLQLLDCCRYPFVQGKNKQWISIKELFHKCRDLSTRDKDICLSYSLSRLLARRYYGFPCAEEDDKVRRFALADLERGDGGYKRAFTIVEVQLAFLHDYFFTASLPIIQTGFFCAAGTSMLLFLFLEVISSFSSGTAIPIPDKLVGTIKMLYLTVLILLVSREVLFGLPFLPVPPPLASYWRPMHTAFCKLISLPNASGDPFQTQTGGAYWRNKIGQYSILQDYDRGRSPKKALVDWFHRAILSQPSYWFIKHLPVEEEEVDMQELDSVRELVADTLLAIDGPPTNGTRSLKINMDEINWAGSADYWLGTCRQETHTDTILIWHIATCYCDMSRRHSGRQEEFPLVAKTDTFLEVATTLSRYCAYLVAFLPEFLPQHSLTTKQVFQRVLQEAQGADALGKTPMEEKQKYTKMRELPPLPHQRELQTTFHKGVRLGRQLEKLNTWLRWKVMAEFWAETILYVSPSDNAEAHIEHLAKGGEFITHLWAMLSNAGILKREPPKKIETTKKARTQECPF